MNWTLRERLNYLGLSPIDNSTLNWAAGDRLQAAYAKVHGDQPDKELRRKTRGGGSHCFAAYPDWFLETMDGILQEMWASYSAFSQQASFNWECEDE